MKLFSIFVFVFCSTASYAIPLIPEPKNDGQNWAVLVAGSNSYYNYGQQADVCHAFHDLVAHGIPESNIIVMMYDDIANDPENPHPGTLINQPNGSDVYQGVKKDYTGEDVNPENFMKVLLGDAGLKAKGEKVLESGPDDNVFIFFTDHGGPLVICFPEEDLPASDLISTLKQMHEKKMYNKLLFYLEACNSGSMFDGLLPNNISIYATTAAGPNESGWMCFCSVPEFNTCLGTQYGVNWVIDSDTGKDFHGETVRKQYLIVKNETNLSHPQEYGDLSIGDMPLSAFQGSVDPPVKPDPIRKCDSPQQITEAPLYLMTQRIARASSEDKPKLREELKQMIRARQFADQSIRGVVEHLCAMGHCQFSEEMLDQREGRITRHECAEKLVLTFSSNCFKTAKHPYTTKYLNAMVNIAEGLPATNLNAKCSQVARDLAKTCIEKIPTHNFKKIL